MGLISLLLVIALALSAAMAGAWAVARQPGRSGWTDAIWSYATGLAGIAGALAHAGGGASPRRWLVAGLVAGWSLRLGTHIALRTIRGGDDPRYAELRRQWGKRFQLRLFLFLQIQAAAAFLLVLSVMAAADNPARAAAWSDFAGIALMVIAVLGEAVADHQLQPFRTNPANHRRVCDQGLWRLSRHPNYFFEWLGWLAYAVIAIGPAGRFGWGWIALSGPALMYVLLVHVSGIPPLEAHMERTRGDAFRRLQGRVNAFWPIPRHHAEDGQP